MTAWSFRNTKPVTSLDVINIKNPAILRIAGFLGFLEMS